MFFTSEPSLWLYTQYYFDKMELSHATGSYDIGPLVIPGFDTDSGYMTSIFVTGRKQQMDKQVLGISDLGLRKQHTGSADDSLFNRVSFSPPLSQTHDLAKDDLELLILLSPCGNYRAVTHDLRTPNNPEVMTLILSLLTQKKAMPQFPRLDTAQEHNEKMGFQAKVPKVAEAKL
ncbi:hypothetical protein STEG23_015223 [Scotinomys teguina]